jgi:hypothetical protein
MAYYRFTPNRVTPDTRSGPALESYASPYEFRGIVNLDARASVSADVPAGGQAPTDPGVIHTRSSRSMQSADWHWQSVLPPPVNAHPLHFNVGSPLGTIGLSGSQLLRQNLR